MKLNHDLIRELLLAIEDISDGHMNFHISHIQEKYLSHYDLDEIHYHVKQLADGRIIYCPPSSNEYVIDLTFYGHQYLSDISCETTWLKVKEYIRPFGTLSLNVISEIAKSIALKSLNLTS